eukprot:UC1_evm1s747
MAGRGANTPGIKKLLEAEAKAADTVKQAKNAKMLRLKRAKEEATAEIARYREQRQTDLDKILAQGSDGDSSLASIASNKESQISALNKTVSANKGEAVSMLVDSVCKVEVKLHVNYKKGEKVSS